MLGHSGVHMFWVSLACGLVVTDDGNWIWVLGSTHRFSKAQVMMRYRVLGLFPLFFFHPSHIGSAPGSVGGGVLYLLLCTCEYPVANPQAALPERYPSWKPQSPETCPTSFYYNHM